MAGKRVAGLQFKLDAPADRIGLKLAAIGFHMRLLGKAVIVFRMKRPAQADLKIDAIGFATC